MESASNGAAKRLRSHGMSAGRGKQDDTFVVPTLSTISEESAWGLDPLRSHKILDQRKPRRYDVQFESRVCNTPWSSQFGECGQPYVDAKHAGWSKHGLNWFTQSCLEHRYTAV